MQRYRRPAHHTLHSWCHFYNFPCHTLVDVLALDASTLNSYHNLECCADYCHDRTGRAGDNYAWDNCGRVVRTTFQWGSWTCGCAWCGWDGDCGGCGGWDNGWAPVRLGPSGLGVLCWGKWAKVLGLACIMLLRRTFLL